MPTHYRKLPILIFTILLDSVFNRVSAQRNGDAVSVVDIDPRNSTFQIRQSQTCNSLFRELDGTCTNDYDPDWASTETAHFSYDSDRDSKIFVKGKNNPEARTISNQLCNQNGGSIPNARGLSSFITFFAQFLDHNIALTDTNPDDVENIEIPKDDKLSQILGGTGFIRFHRSKRQMVSGMEVPINELSSALDLGAVYGFKSDIGKAIREGRNGRLLSPDGLLPRNVGGKFRTFPINSADFYLAGDHRANDNPVLTSLHILFVREHNRLADELIKEDMCSPGMTSEECDEEIYQLARRFNGAQMQKIVYEEFFPILTNRLSRYGEYDNSINPAVSSLFSTAAFRFGHSLIPESIERRGPNMEKKDARLLQMMFGLTADDFEKEPNEVETLLRGAIFSKAEEFDTLVVDGLRNFLFINIAGEKAGGLDLISLNIQRSRDHNIPLYNEARILFRLPPVTSFSEITSDTDQQRKLEEVYGDVDFIDAWIGLMSEDKVSGSSFGETMIAIWTEEFDRISHGDRLHYRRWDQYPPKLEKFSRFEQLKVGRKLMNQIVLRNTEITESELGPSVWQANQNVVSAPSRPSSSPSPSPLSNQPPFLSEEDVCESGNSDRPIGCGGIDESGS